MKYQFLSVLMLGAIVSFIQAGVICEFKINQARAGLEAYQKKSNPNPSKLQQARNELESLLAHCDDMEILREVQAYIIDRKSNLEAANATLANARAMQDSVALQQAQLAQKLAHIQYIAARQEELKLRDLLKSTQ